jgi:hypothetical protein
MSTRPARRKEVYARLATQLRTHDRAVQAEKECPGAMGMYAFLLMQARGEITWGDVLEATAETSWGAPVAYRRRQAKALVNAGLVERRDGRLVVVRYGEHNDTPDIVEANRARERTKKRGQRGAPDSVPVPVYDLAPTVPESASVPRGHTGDSPPLSLVCPGQGTPSVSPISTSRSPSGSGSRPGDQDPPGRSPTARADEVPAWFAGAAESAAMAVGGDIAELPVRWANYVASRKRKSWPMGHEDAVSWLCDVVRGERERAANRPHLRAVRPQDIVQPEIPGSWQIPAEMP